MRFKIPFALLLATVGATACYKKPCTEDAPVGICPSPGPTPGPGIAPGGCVGGDTTACDGVVCTADFRYVRIDVTTSTGAPVTLDSFVVVDASGVPLPAVNGVAQYGYYGTPGSYAVISDAWARTHRNQSMSVVAKGYLGGVQVVSQPTIISADCCHVAGSPSNTTIVVSAL